MQSPRKITNALISVYYKDGLEPIIKALSELGITMYSTGGTRDFIEKAGAKVKAVEDLTGYPSILGGRVKTLHPKVFGGILARRGNEQDQKEMAEFGLPFFDLVIVDLYPFEETLKNTSDEALIIEKIDVGGVSLIRAAAKNFADTIIVADKKGYSTLTTILTAQKGESSIEQRKDLARNAFEITSKYDGLIHQYFNGTHSTGQATGFADSIGLAKQSRVLRYGENPHQEGVFYGNAEALFDQLHGKDLSYNNLLDMDAAVNLIGDFEKPTVAVIKHNNPCGVASRENILDAWKDALAGDPVSAFGGIVIANRQIDVETATEMDRIFLEVLIAPSYDAKALEVLKGKKNRIILALKGSLPTGKIFRSILNGVVEQDRDSVVLKETDLKLVTNKTAEKAAIQDLLFADKLVKHAKSNTIVLAKNGQLLGIGCGQTSRVDALRQAIEKAKTFEFNLEGAVMSSDAFFPFPDCVEIAEQAGIRTVIQPGGSIKDDASVSYCNAHGMAMYFTGIRHFKH